MVESFAKIFAATDQSDYQQWRADKLGSATGRVPVVAIRDPYQLTTEEVSALRRSCCHNNIVVYQLKDASQTDKSLVSALGEQIGLTHLDANLRADGDGISALHVTEQAGNQYIPYTNKALSWHTDGYYNEPGAQVNAIIMHCAVAASSGGTNQLMDHELIYLMLRDENPAFVEALKHPQAMTIPANIESGKEIRAAQTGPVFSLHEASGRLHMRFSARKRNIQWRDDELTRQAVLRINEILADASMISEVSLQPGQGIVCNNVLHNRSAFVDDAGCKRLLYRARYYDRVASL